MVRALQAVEPQSGKSQISGLSDSQPMIVSLSSNENLISTAVGCVALRPVSVSSSDPRTQPRFQGTVIFETRSKGHIKAASLPRMMK